ncbi:TEC1 family protein [Abortiporus biennis]
MPPSASSRQFAQHVRVSSTEDLSYTVPASGSGETNDVIQTIVTGRKCWKTIKGKGEVVWPPYLEAALVEALEKYRPVETRSTRALGRFPMRNKFISDYIFNATGKRRTPKQVGSRLQQLRDTCEGKRILKLLSSRRAPSPKIEEEVHTNHRTSEPLPEAPMVPCDYVSIDVLPCTVEWSSTDVGSIPSPINSDPSSSGHRSPTAIDAQSCFVVRLNNTRVHTETTKLDQRSNSLMPAPQWPYEPECSFLYSTTLVPRYWKQLCELTDLSSYTITQEIVRVPSSSELEGATPPSRDVMLSIVYSFHMASIPSMSPPQSPLSTGSMAGSADLDVTGYSTTSSPDLRPEYDNNLAMFNTLSPGLPPTLPPFSHLAHHTQYARVPYDMPPPELIPDSEDGPASLPQSPLDFTFPPTINGMVSGAGRHSVQDLSQNMCNRYVDVDGHGIHGQQPCYDNINMGLGGGLPSLNYNPY